MVTLAGTQNFNELNCIYARFWATHFEITLEKAGASAVILASENSMNPSYIGIEIAAFTQNWFRIFANLVHVRIEEWGCFNKRHFRNANWRNSPKAKKQLSNRNS
jgi:hypothetical protein